MYIYVIYSSTSLYSIILFRPIKCVYCAQQIPLIDLKNHENNCIEHSVLCVNKCGEMIRTKKMDTHVNKDCVYRFVACPLLCSYKIRFNDKYDHITNMCTNRITKCTNNCLISENPHTEDNDYTPSTQAIVTELSQLTEFPQTSDSSSVSVSLSMYSTRGNDTNSLVDMNDEIKKGVYEHNKKEKIIQLNKIKIDKEHERMNTYNENDIRQWERVFKMKAKLLPVHLKNECPKRIIHCGKLTKLYIYMYMYMHMYKCIHRYICMYIFNSLYRVVSLLSTLIELFIAVSMYIHTCVCIYEYDYVCTYTRIYQHTYIHIFAYIYMNVSIYKHIFIYMFIFYYILL